MYVNWVVISQPLEGITQTVARAHQNECMKDIYSQDVTNHNIHNFIGILQITLGKQKWFAVCGFDIFCWGILGKYSK